MTAHLRIIKIALDPFYLVDDEASPGAVSCNPRESTGQDMRQNGRIYWHWINLSSRVKGVEIDEL